MSAHNPTDHQTRPTFAGSVASSCCSWLFPDVPDAAAAADDVDDAAAAAAACVDDDTADGEVVHGDVDEDDEEEEEEQDDGGGAYCMQLDPWGEEASPDAAPWAGDIVVVELLGAAFPALWWFSVWRRRERASQYDLPQPSALHS